jgi:caffeoyl-CoA O-methyltransferase
MPLPLPEDLDRYIADHSSAENPVLAEISRATHERTDQPEMMVGHIEGLFLRTLVRTTGAKRVLEIGTFTGYSALAMAEGLPDDGEIITCDVDAETTAIAQAHWDKSPHGKKIELHLGPAMETIEALDGPFDIVFIDADKESYIDYWEACIPKLRPGGLVVVDNVLWSGRVLDPQDPVEHAIVAFNQHTAGDTRTERVMLPIRDGVLLAVRL